MPQFFLKTAKKRLTNAKARDIISPLIQRQQVTVKALIQMRHPAEENLRIKFTNSCLFGRECFFGIFHS